MFTVHSAPLIAIYLKKFADQWESVLAYNFSSLGDNEKQQLESITASNMTDALVTYVLDMSDEDIKVRVTTMSIASLYYFFSQYI